MCNDVCFTHTGRSPQCSMCAVRWKDVGQSWLILATYRFVSATTQSSVNICQSQMQFKFIKVKVFSKLSSKHVQILPIKLKFNLINNLTKHSLRLITCKGGKRCQFSVFLPFHLTDVDILFCIFFAHQHHIKYQHLLKKKYVCPHPSCGRLFRLQKQLLRHAKHHTGTHTAHT